MPTSLTISDLRLRWDEAFRVVALGRDRTTRRVPWCLIDHARPETLDLLDRLTADWGTGIACLDQAGRTTGDHGLSLDESSRIQQRCLVRVWLDSEPALDPTRVRATLCHGCLPLVLVPEARHPALCKGLAVELQGFTMALPSTGPLPRWEAGAMQRRWVEGVSLLLQGPFAREASIAG